MVLVDTSAWIEFVRATESAADRQLTARLTSGLPVGTTDPVVLELLATASSSRERWRLRAALDTCEYLAQVPRADVDAAVELFEVCRRSGQTLRSSTDCLIAAIAIRHDVPVLHRDRDFEIMAQHTSLALVVP